MNSCVDIPVVSDGSCSHRFFFCSGSSSFAKKSMASLISVSVGCSYIGTCSLSFRMVGISSPPQIFAAFSWLLRFSSFAISII